MRSLTTTSLAALLALVATGAGAQMTKTLTGEMKTETATVEAIETSTREVTLKKSDGTYTVARVGKEIKRFDTLKVGDKITAKYYDNIVLRLKAPGEADVDSQVGIDHAGGRRAGGRHGGCAAHDHRHHHGHRSGVAVDHVQGPQRLDVHFARRR